MKRVAADSNQSNPVTEDARVRIRHQSLLQDYLELQKEFVLNNKKLQTTYEKKDVLVGEVRFLRQRHRYLLDLRSQELEPEQDFGQPKIKDMQLAKDSVCGANGTVLKKLSPVAHSDPVLSAKGNLGMKEEVVLDPYRVNKKPKNCLINGKRIKKKKISWQDQLALKV
ncbi:hypothetical protein CFOL_v3_27729 [Cephalotus follicularis]|uniref:Uncharacterized protein n=1 Tax=Cephalotus follicularis TaxID=3775 RepID=A0A1Q3CVU1_CEPFO|nr:hypothetical protein CFOL_v3_27729 [Cephalotus follicularis]